MLLQTANETRKPLNNSLAYHGSFFLGFRSGFFDHSPYLEQNVLHLARVLRMYSSIVVGEPVFPSMITPFPLSFLYGAVHQMRDALAFDDPHDLERDRIGSSWSNKDSCTEQDRCQVDLDFVEQPAFRHCR
jgi:hypothetical protein